MIGHRVRVVRKDAIDLEGVLLKTDATGVIIHNSQGLNDDRRFIPFFQIIEIKDLGRAP